MKKLIIIPILFIAILLGGYILLSGYVKNKTASSDPESSTSQISKSSSLQPPQAGFIPISDSQDGVEVTVEDVRKEDGKTVIELAMNNHRYDLEDMDTKNRSSFSGTKPSEYIVKSLAMGGHHVQAEMVFDKELSGPLTISLNDSLVFNFNIQ